MFIWVEEELLDNNLYNDFELYTYTKKKGLISVQFQT